MTDDVLRPLAASVLWVGLWISLFMIVKTNDRDDWRSLKLIRAIALQGHRSLSSNNKSRCEMGGTNTHASLCRVS